MKKTDSPVPAWAKEWEEMEQIKLMSCWSEGHNWGQRTLRKIPKLKITAINKYFFFMVVIRTDASS
jgi:hypothetical protein